MQADEQTQSLVAYFSQSKKALTQGQALCSRASTLNAETASVVIEAVSYEAKARWMNEGILDQLNVGTWFRSNPSLVLNVRKLAAAVSKSLSLQRSKLLEEARVSSIVTA